MRRLQLECEHQLDLERHRNEELARSASATEAKLRTAEARADAVEAAFAEYRESQRHTSEAALQTELAEARREVSQARQRACEAVAAKEAYKSRVVRLASDLSALQRARAADQVGSPTPPKKEAPSYPSFPVRTTEWQEAAPAAFATSGTMHKMKKCG